MIADGVVGMEGDGPSAGNLVHLDFLAASGDGAALDAALCRMLGIRTRAVPYLRWIRRDGLGETDVSRIEILGDGIAEVAPAAFRPPNTLGARLVPPWLVRFFGPLLWCRPEFADRCVRCGLCVRTCPAGALRMENGDVRPVLNPRVCIECCCCHEVCPEKAVQMRLSPVLSMIRRKDRCLR